MAKHYLGGHSLFHGDAKQVDPSRRSRFHGEATPDTESVEHAAKNRQRIKDDDARCAEYRARARQESLERLAELKAMPPEDDEFKRIAIKVEIILLEREVSDLAQ